MSRAVWVFAVLVSFVGCSAPADIKDSPLIRISDGETRSGCVALKRKTGIVIRGAQAQDEDLFYLIADSDGRQQKYYIYGADELDDQTTAWLDLIMVPGRRIHMDFESCDSGRSLSLTTVQVQP